MLPLYCLYLPIRFFSIILKEHKAYNIKAILGASEANIQKGITYDLEEVLRNDSQLFFFY